MSPQALLILALGILAGVLSGMFGIGGGIVIVPALVFLFHFSEHQAVATSLAALLPPVALLGVLEHWRMGNVRITSAALLCVGILVGAKFGAQLANRVSGPELRLSFGAFVTMVGLTLIVTAARKL